MTHSLLRNGRPQQRTLWPIVSLIGALGLCACALAGDERAVAARDAGAGGATLLHSPNDPLVALRVVLRAGSQDDPPGKEVAWRSAHRLDGRRGGQQDAHLQPDSGGLLPDGTAQLGRVFASKENTVFSGVVHRDNLAAYESDRDRDDRGAEVRPRRLRAAAQRGR